MLIRLKTLMLGVVGSFVLFAAYLAVPPLGIFSGILAPLPVAYNRLVRGRIFALVIILAATTAITALFGIFAGCFYLGMCAMIGLFMPELLLHDITGSRTLFWTTAANMLIFTISLIAYTSLSGVNLLQLLSTEIADGMKQAIAIYEKRGVSGEELEFVKRSMATASQMLQRLYPALVTIMFVVIAGCNLVLLKKTAVKTDLKLAIGDFGSYRNPELLVWLLIAIGFSLLLPDTLLTTAELNILLLIVMLYFLQGMAVVTALVTKHSVPAFVRILMYTMLIIQPYLLALVAGIGLFDLWADFRTPKPPQENL